MHHAVIEAKRKIVRSAVEHALGDYDEAARLLGIHVHNLHRLILELELKPERALGLLRRETHLHTGPKT